jgi:zinc transport system substrate-binding protein
MTRIFTLFLFLCAVTPALATPKIVVSIPPIFSLVSSITHGITRPELLLTQGSPHNASLRPSQASALANADLLIWVGPELESFLAQPIKRLVKPGVELQLLTLEALKRLPQREGGFWEEDEHETAHEAAHTDHRFNPHIWLAPENAQQIAAAVSNRLCQIDPAHQAGYQQNLIELTRRIQDFAKNLQQQLKPIQGKPYLVFHDAYPYFEDAFSLNALGSVRVSADRPPGAKRIQEIREKMVLTHAGCLFSEPQFSPTLAQRLAADGQLKLGVLDPLGSRSDNSEDDWFNLMQNLATSLKSCLEDSPL